MPKTKAQRTQRLVDETIFNLLLFYGAGFNLETQTGEYKNVDKALKKLNLRIDVVTERMKQDG